jgi:hypothetical protein
MSSSKRIDLQRDFAAGVDQSYSRDEEKNLSAALEYSMVYLFI